MSSMLVDEKQRVAHMSRHKGRRLWWMCMQFALRFFG